MMRRLIWICVLMVALFSVGLGSLGYAPVVAHAASTLSVGPEETVYTYPASTSNGIYSDGAFGILQDGNHFDFYGSNGSGVNSTVTSTGPLNDPLQTIHQDGLSITGLPSGTFNYTAIYPVYKDLVTGDIIGFVHLERWANGNPADFWASVGMVISTDGGNSFTWLGEIIQPQVPFSNSNTQGYEIGFGAYALVNPSDDPTNTYFYIYSMDHWSNGNAGISVSRAKVSTVLSNAINGQSTPFENYYNGSFSQPSLGGTFTDIAPSLNGNAVPDSVQYNSKLGQYMLALRDYTPGYPRVSIITSSNPVDFNTADGATEYIINDNSSEYSVYPRMVGFGANPETESGGSFYVYYMAWPSNQGLWQSGTKMVRRLVTVNNGNPSGIVNGSFESPDVTYVSGNYEYDPPGDGWTYVNGAGVVEQNNSAWGTPNAPDGTQMAFVQGPGTISQTVNLEAGTYVLGFAAARRTNYGGQQTFNVLVDGNIVGAFSPSSGSFYSYTTNAFTVGAGSHTIEIQGAVTTDSTDFIDQVQIMRGVPASNGFSSTQGQNNWYYQMWNGSQYVNLSWDAANNRWDDGSFCIVGNNWQHPDGYDSARVWQAPASGWITITGNVAKADTGGGDGVNAKIMNGNQEIWPSSGGWQYIAYNNSTGYNFNIQTFVNAGDRIYFVLNENGNDTYDTTNWNPNIAYTNSLVTSESLSGTLRNNFTGSVGFQFTTGSSAPTVTALGRYYVSGNTGTHTISIYQDNNGALVTAASVTMAPGSADSLGYEYATLPSPMTLQPNTTYDIVSSETNGGDTWYDYGTTINVGDGVTVNQAVSLSNGIFTGNGTSNSTYGPVNFLYK